MLQILQEQHAELFHLLGKTSGRDVDKIADLEKLGVQLDQQYGLPVIAGETATFARGIVAGRGELDRGCNDVDKNRAA
jgi:hypothetical protein